MFEKNVQNDPQQTKKSALPPPGKPPGVPRDEPRPQPPQPPPSAPPQDPKAEKSEEPPGQEGNGFYMRLNSGSLVWFPWTF